MNSVIGQRLVRRICDACKSPTTLAPDVVARIQGILDMLPSAEKEKIAKKELVFYTGKGCEACHGIGFKGRIGIYEILTMNPEIEQMILTGQVSEFEMEKIAIAHGMVTMVQDGILKALDGITSVDEVFRVIE